MEGRETGKGSFLTDGFISQRDYLLVISTSVFFAFVVIGLIFILMGKPVESTYLALLNTVSDVVMTIVLSVFGVDGVGKVTDYLETKSKNQNAEISKIKETEREVIKEINHYPEVVDSRNYYESEEDVI